LRQQSGSIRNGCAKIHRISSDPSNALVAEGRDPVSDTVAKLGDWTRPTVLKLPEDGGHQRLGSQVPASAGSVGVLEDDLA
jgi:hypothetical protein